MHVEQIVGCLEVCNFKSGSFSVLDGLRRLQCGCLVLCSGLKSALARKGKEFAEFKSGKPRIPAYQDDTLTQSAA